jgi:hypothetical protein
MNATTGSTAPSGLRGWWANPPRSGMRRIINPIAYRHPRVLSRMHLAGGSVAVVPAIICLSYSAFAWAAFFLAIAALNLGASRWYSIIARDTAA